MFSGRIRTVVRLASVSRTFVLKPIKCQPKFNRIILRRYTNKDIGFVPEQIHQLLNSTGGSSEGLLKPFLFSAGFTCLTFIGCAIWEYENRVKSKRRSRSRPRGRIGRWWHSLNEGDKVFFKILFANVLVFAAWRCQPCLPFMVKYFLSSPGGKAPYLSMVLSAFSHHSVLHLAGNMFVLESFMPAAVDPLGKEQFVGMYLSGAVFSNFASFAYKIIRDDPGLSLGASGAIMTVLAYVCFKYPDTKLSIIFLPQVQFSASSAMMFMMGIDFAGVILGSKVFDHAAHLGGALFGIFWHWFGSKHIWGNRDDFIQFYRSIRKGAS